MWRLIVILILALVVAVFAIDNATPVSVHFLVWSLPRMGLALVILISALLGAILGVAVGLSQLFRERRTHRQEMVTVPVADQAAPAVAPSTPEGTAEPPALESEPADGPGHGDDGAPGDGAESGSA